MHDTRTDTVSGLLHDHKPRAACDEGRAAYQLGCLHATLVGCTAALPHCEGAAPNEAARSPAIERDGKTRGTIETHHKLIRTLAGHAHEWHTSSSTRAQRAVTLWSHYGHIISSTYQHAT